MEEEDDALPTDDDLLGKNGAYHQSIAILHHGLNEMGRKLDGIKISGGGDAEVHGQFPSYVVSQPDSNPPQRINEDPEPYAFEMKFNGVDQTVRFLPGFVLIYPVSADPIYPSIGVDPINVAPYPTLPINVNGAVVWLKHTYTWELTGGGADCEVTTNSVEIVQFDYGTNPVPVRNAISYGAPAPVTGNIAYIMLCAYSAGFKTTYQSVDASFVVPPSTDPYTPASLAYRAVYQANDLYVTKPAVKQAL